MPTVVIIGAGAVGVNAALFLRRLGISSVVLDEAPDILHGAAEASFINHGDGFEYYKRGHSETGKQCIDGAMTKGLIYPLHALATTVCSEERPIRFFLAQGSLGVGGLTIRRFLGNAEHMREHFRRQFESIRTACGWSEEEAEQIFLRRPATFARALAPNEYPDVASVAAACAGSSFGINMAHYYALLKAAMRECAIEFYPQSAPSAIERDGAGYRIHAAGRVFRAERVLITAGHHIPLLAASIRGSSIVPPPEGTYFLNAMTFLRLPATDERVRLEGARRINFTLQQEHGSMFACIVPPSPTEEGFAATYYPSPQGSQLRQHRFDPAAPAAPPADWDDLVTTGLQPDDENVQRTFRQAKRLYPFLDGYAEVSHTICRTVFNAATHDSDHGNDRRVREIPTGGRAITSDGMVTAWTAPKWTNAELVALMATDEIASAVGMRSFTERKGNKLGPLRFDVAAISRQLNFHKTRMNAGDALSYAKRQKIPSRIVELTLPHFANSDESA